MSSRPMNRQIMLLQERDYSEFHDARPRNYPFQRSDRFALATALPKNGGPSVLPSLTIDPRPLLKEVPAAGDVHDIVTAS